MGQYTGHVHTLIDSYIFHDALTGTSKTVNSNGFRYQYFSINKESLILFRS